MNAPYLVCATPRSGSNLLCGLLKSTRVAGRPEEYFWVGFEHVWEEEWNAATPAGYLDGALRMGSTPNGVFGAKLMWDHLPTLFAKLAGAHGEREGSDRERLECWLSGFRCVWIWREDVVAQAVSFSKAIQTDVWTGDERAPWAGESRARASEARFDFNEIDELVRRLEHWNAAWRRWFAANRLDPYAIRYEDLIEDLQGVTRGVLDFLGVELPAGTAIEAQHTRLHDGVNDEWAARYRAAAAAAG